MKSTLGRWRKENAWCWWNSQPSWLQASDRHCLKGLCGLPHTLFSGLHMCTYAPTCTHRSTHVHWKRENSSQMISNQSVYAIAPMARVCRITRPSHESLVLPWGHLYSSSHFSPVHPAAFCFFTSAPGKGQICVPILDPTIQWDQCTPKAVRWLVKQIQAI